METDSVPKIIYITNGLKLFIVNDSNYLIEINEENFYDYNYSSVRLQDLVGVHWDCTRLNHEEIKILIFQVVDMFPERFNENDNGDL